jgi:gamma-glutamylcyclotransferase (GGCT)/AIG2-like uncharacterized protein YtfP
MPTRPAPASHLLFTYGTLMLTTGIAAVDEAMRKAGVSLGRGYVHGHLYDLGEYPGAVAPGAATALTSGIASVNPDDDEPRVWGHLLRLADPEALFAVLDPYEGFDAGNPSASEFVRARVGVLLAGSETPLEAQIYWYNFPLPGRARIDSGDYLAHWAAKGKPRQARIR